ncbi:hypothetical protein DFH06DRAFT_1317120 [Mycena polygramma]|nr:hypothetical protein DFH06DRAFT_1317120 [Mycena polygramma]
MLTSFTSSHAIATERDSNVCSTISLSSSIVPFSPPLESVAALPATSVRLSSPRKRGAIRRAYAVFFGRTPGWYNSWAETNSMVSGAQGTLFQAYPSEDAAQAAYTHAEARSWTGVCSPSSFPYQAIPERHRPTPAVISEPLSPLHCGTWYVVYKGIVPGVYQSFLECGLNTIGISGSSYDSFVDKQVAFAQFAEALEGA